MLQSVSSLCLQESLRETQFSPTLQTYMVWLKTDVSKESVEKGIVRSKLQRLQLELKLSRSELISHMVRCHGRVPLVGAIAGCHGGVPW